MNLPESAWSGDYPLTVPVTRAASDAFNAWLSAHEQDINNVLAPYGISLLQMVAVDYRRVITPDEIAEHGGRVEEIR